MLACCLCLPGCRACSTQRPLAHRPCRPWFSRCWCDAPVDGASVWAGANRAQPVVHATQLVVLQGREATCAPAPRAALHRRRAFANAHPLCCGLCAVACVLAALCCVCSPRRRSHAAWRARPRLPRLRRALRLASSSPPFAAPPSGTTPRFAPAVVSLWTSSRCGFGRSCRVWVCKERRGGGQRETVGRPSPAAPRARRCCRAAAVRRVLARAVRAVKVFRARGAVAVHCRLPTSARSWPSPSASPLTTAGRTSRYVSGCSPAAGAPPLQTALVVVCTSGTMRHFVRDERGTRRGAGSRFVGHEVAGGGACTTCCQSVRSLYLTSPRPGRASNHAAGDARALAVSAAREVVVAAGHRAPCTLNPVSAA